MEQWGLQNTYFVAKTLSERLVQSFDQKPFPVCIVRPSLIGCVAGDPFPGFIGNTSGFTGLVLGSLAGVSPSGNRKDSPIRIFRQLLGCFRPCLLVFPALTKGFIVACMGGYQATREELVDVGLHK